MGQILLMKIFSNFKRCCFLSIFKIIQKKLQNRFSAAQPLWGGRRGMVSKPLATNLCHLITSFIIFRFSFGFISSKTRRRAKSGGEAWACFVKFAKMPRTPPPPPSLPTSTSFPVRQRRWRSAIARKTIWRWKTRPTRASTFGWGSTWFLGPSSSLMGSLLVTKSIQRVMKNLLAFPFILSMKKSHSVAEWAMLLFGTWSRISSSWSSPQSGSCAGLSSRRASSRWMYHWCLASCQQCLKTERRGLCLF